MISQEEIYQRVSAILIEALNADEDEIKPTATLQGDLGAESIDSLDILFRLEREFAIKISRAELFPAGFLNEDPELVQGGKLTDKGLQVFRNVGCFDLSKFEDSPELANVSDLFTVGMICRYIQGKLDD